MKNNIIVFTILMMGIMGACLPLRAAGSGLDLLWTWNKAEIESLFIDGNKAYIGSYQYFYILRISTELPPRVLAEMPMTAYVSSIYVSGKYAYVVDSWGRYAGPMPDSGLRIIDISAPRNPRQVGFHTNCSMDKCNVEFLSIFVSGNYAYIVTGDSGGTGGVDIFDISNPASPKRKGHHGCGLINDFSVSGNYAYCAFCLPSNYDCTRGGLLVIDISSPVSPMGKSSLTLNGCKWVQGFDFFNGYAYVSGYDYKYRFGSLDIIDVTDPGSPQWRYSHRTKGTANDVNIAGNYAFIADGKAGLSVLNISNPDEPVEVADYETPGEATKVSVNGDYVYVVDDSAGLLLLKISNPLIKLHWIALDKTQLGFGAAPNISTAAQDVSVHNEGTGALYWNAAPDAGWLTVSPQVGEGDGIISVNADPDGLSPGIYNGIVTITDPQAYNGPQEVKVTLKIYPTGSVPPPFGCIDTPIEGSTVMNGIPVTGWVLHDIGVKSVRIFREDGWGEGKTPICIGNAFFLEGSRPDIEAAYPDYPFSEKAGWGYMILTNLFPGGGNGQFTLHAVAQTLDGQKVTLGTKKIVCDNAHSAIPFGNIYNPRQGSTVSSGWFKNTAWVLTPLPKNIPTDGSTIYVFVDGVKLGHPIYNLASPAITTLFPGYANSERARGYFNLHTVGYEKGLHTVEWVAIDSNKDMGGIGSRYFLIQDSDSSRERFPKNDFRKTIKMTGDLDRIPGNYMDPIKIEKGFRKEPVDRELFPENGGVYKVEIKELEHIEIQLGENITDIQGYMTINRQLRPLPIGSTLDTKTGKFYWSPGPGYLGRYDLVFVIKDADNRYYKKEIEINIAPLFDVKSQVFP
ncbi:MAG: hypothetical protein NT166_18345 [Candidatus Aminicenantes bacterium]|nr:hypothetical protein [Candidatus Aminicenantes bacterium]